MSSFDLLDKTPDESLHNPFEKFTIGGKTYYANSADLEQYDFTSCQNILSPLSFNSNILQTGGGFIDVDISGQTCVHHIDDLVLNMVVQNTSSTNPALLLPMPYVINRVEIQMNGGQNVETIYSQNIMTTTINSTDEINANRAISEGYDPATYGPDGTGILASSSRSYNMPLHSFLSKLFFPVVASCKLRIYFNGGSSVLTSASVATASNLIMQSFNIYLQGRCYAPHIVNMLIQRYRQATHISRGIIRRYQLINLGATTAGVQLSQTLSAFTGTFVYLRCLLLATGATQENQLPNNFKAWQNISLINSAGTPWSFQNIPQDLIRYVWNPSKYNSKATTVVNQLELDFAADPYASFKQMKDTGSLFMDGRYLLKPTPNVTAAGGLDLIVCSLQECLVCVNPNGSVEIKEQ